MYYTILYFFVLFLLTYCVCSGMSMLSPAERVKSCESIFTLDVPSWERTAIITIIHWFKVGSYIKKTHWKTYHLPDPYITLTHCSVCLPRSKHHCLLQLQHRHFFKNQQHLVSVSVVWMYTNLLSQPPNALLSIHIQK